VLFTMLPLAQVSYNFQFGQMCVDPVYNCSTESVNVTFAMRWQLPSSITQLWNMDVNNLPSSPPVYSFVNSTAAAEALGGEPVNGNPAFVRPYSFASDSTIRTYANFPNAIDVCDRPTCTHPLVTVRRNFPANVTAWVSELVDVGVSLGGLSKLVSVPSKLSISYAWVGIYPSMTLDPVFFVDGNGKLFLGDLNIKVLVLVFPFVGQHSGADHWHDKDACSTSRSQSYFPASSRHWQRSTACHERS
jgi:hypothetical protein